MKTYQWLAWRARRYRDLIITAAPVGMGSTHPDPEDVQDEVTAYVNEHAPSGSGIDAGTTVTLANCRKNRLVIYTEFHHMNEHGVYDGWTEHEIILTPDFETPGYDMRITGRDRNGIKNCLGDIYSEWLNSEVSE